MARPIAVLTSTTDKLQAYGSGAAATTNPTVTVLYHDIPQQVKTDFSEYRYGRQYTVLAGATETDILDAPTQGVIRVVDRIVVYNADTANFTVFVAIDDNTTNRIQVRKTLATLESLVGDEEGWDAVTGVFATGVTSTQVLYSSSGVATGSANMTFNGTKLTVAGLLDSALTSGRVPYATTGGEFIDSANLTFNGTTLTVHTATISTGALTGVHAQFTGFSAPASGTGAEVFIFGGEAFLQGYNRTGGAYVPVKVNGSTATLQIAAVDKLTVDASGNTTLAGTLTTSAPTGGSGAWELGIANSVSPTSPNRTITVEIGGTAYYIHAKTTND